MTDTFDHTLMHVRKPEAPSISFAVSEGLWTHAKVQTCKRLIAAYKASVNQEQNAIRRITEEDLWSRLMRENLSELLECLKEENAEKLSHYLTNFGLNYTWFGGITTGVDGYNHWDQSSPTVAFSYFDKLVCLAEALGILTVENPEQGLAGNWGRNIDLAPQEIADRISHFLGIVITPPAGVIPVAGIRLSTGILHYRHVNAIYTATRLRDLTSPEDHIAEYGAGLGFVAYYLRLMSRKNVTLFDLPLTNVISGFFLIGALGHDAVSLEGEVTRPETIKIKASWNCMNEAADQFRVTLNQDSFPEISREIFSHYARSISNSTSGYFLSVNHEVEHRDGAGFKHLNVSRLLSSDRSFRRISRQPYWIRRGYVEELYRVGPSTGQAATDAPVGTKQKFDTGEVTLPPYDHDGLHSVHNHEFETDPVFIKAYARGVKAAAGHDYGWYWRVHVGLWAARVASSLDGDFVECGVNRGFMASAIMEDLSWDKRKKTFFLLDTFTGLDFRFVTQSEIAEGVREKNQAAIDSGFYVTNIDAVRENFREWKNIVLIEGAIPETLPQIISEKIAFVHVDLNCSPPEIAAMLYLWDRLVPGAVVLLDDYGYTGYRQQKLGMDKFARGVGVSIVSLPTGQGLLIKPEPNSKAIASESAEWMAETPASSTTCKSDALLTDEEALKYIASYEDLIAAFGIDSERAKEHYLRFGKSEGRSPTFDALMYLVWNPDLGSIYELSIATATKHYIQFGFKEGRRAK